MFMGQQCWILATVAGCYIGLFITQNLYFIRLDIALSAMFLSIVVLYFKSKGRERNYSRYGLIITANIALTLLLLYYELKSLAFFTPALAIAAVVFLLDNKKRA